MATWSVKAAILCAAAGAGCLHLYLSQYEAEMRGGDPVAVIALSRDLAAGSVLTEADMDERGLPERYLDERHVPASDLTRVVGNRILVDVAAGDALLWTDIGVSESHMQLSELVALGRRAARIEGEGVSFGGLLRPGDRVDVLLTARRAGPLDGSPRETRTLLEGVLVLAVGDRIAPAGEGRARRAGSVTLSVLPAQARVLASGRRQGELAVVVRNPEDLALSQAALEGGDGR